MTGAIKFSLPDSGLIRQVTHIPVATTSENIGDDIQSEAACRLFGVRKFVPRDDMASWPSESLTTLVGWYSQKPFNGFPNVLVISFHANRVAMQQLLLCKKTRSWFSAQVRQQGFPAMCRDRHTMRFLRGIGIDAEFGGCITSSLSSKGVKKELWVNIEYPIDREARQHPGMNFIHLTQHNRKLPKMSPEERLEIASRRINVLDASHIVLTSKLHILLPCIALGTRVLLDITKADTIERFTLGGFIGRGHHVHSSLHVQKMILTRGVSGPYEWAGASTE